MRQPVRTLPYFATAMKYVESWRQYGKYLNILQTLPYYTCCFLPQIFISLKFVKSLNHLRLHTK